MLNELAKKDTDLISVIKDNELGDIIKPLIRDIHLFDSFIAGTAHLPDPSVLDKLQPGDVLTLQRAADKFDADAVMILSPDRVKLGFVPEKDEIVFARLMDAGKILRARVTGIEDRGGLRLIGIGIYLMDI